MGACVYLGTTKLPLLLCYIGAVWWQGVSWDVACKLEARFAARIHGLLGPPVCFPDEGVQGPGKNQDD